MIHRLAEHSIRPLQQSDIAAFLPNMRSADAAEVLATSGVLSEAHLWETARQSQLAFTWAPDGIVGALFGVHAESAMSLMGHPWLITTTLVDRKRKAFLKASRAAVDEFSKQFPELENHVDTRYVCAQHWLRRLGFTIEPPEPWGIAGQPFNRFWMKTWAG